MEGDKQLYTTSNGCQHVYDEYDDIDLPAYAYACRYGLVANHRDENPFHVASLPSPPEPLCADLKHLNTAIEKTTIAQVNAVDANQTPERWNVDRATARLIASVVDLTKNQDFREISDR